MKKFVKNQLSAGKKNYNEEQFFRGMSLISVISYFCTINRWKKYEYDLHINGKMNPQVRFVSKYDIIIYVEVKTPGFNQENIDQKKMIPTILLY